MTATVSTFPLSLRNFPITVFRNPVIKNSRANSHSAFNLKYAFIDVQKLKPVIRQLLPNLQETRRLAAVSDERPGERWYGIA